ncbi:hypothetical protein [[Mycobacterium] crassicus]|uniref:Tail assembly chaperone n=1 Tax=[Mycobacterium] crassicus TaxID=2872309 RepID=A0ABU5XGM5_9MYCO|nr:hypothetical protein [Mycolicibacter sp. MYC098]MEB3021313.1 hypothetical protein [Mycolicibacter sp. MYC098]
MTENPETARIPEPEKRLHVVNAVDAREQASEALSFLASEFRRVKPDAKHPEGELFEIPHKDLFDPEQQDRYEQLLHEIRDYDREPEVPEVRTSDGTLIRAARPGDLIEPHQKDGKLIRPTWSERLGIVLWGKDGAARFRKGGGNFNEISLVWGRQAHALRKWREADSKSADSDSGMAPAADSD